MNRTQTACLSDIIDTTARIENELYAAGSYLQNEQRACQVFCGNLSNRLIKLHRELEEVRDKLEMIETAEMRPPHWQFIRFIVAWISGLFKREHEATTGVTTSSARESS